MTLATAEAFASYLRASADLDGIAIHTSSDDKEIPGDAAAIVISCDTAESPVAGLYRATVQLVLSTPCIMADGLETHHGVAAILRPLLALTGLAAHFPSHLAYSGRHLTQWSESREDDRWITTAELVIGVREI